MSYSKVFDADTDGQVTADDLTFKDFSSGIQPDISGSGRISPAGDATARLYQPDRELNEQLGRAGSSSSGWFRLDAFQQWFDVDTQTVLERAWRTLYPRDDYLNITVNGQPDLYGPFWVPSTLVFALFLSSSLSSSIQAYLAGNAYNYDFTALSVAVTVVYIYSLAVPVAMWAIIRYWAGVDERGPVDLICVYGYSTTVWIFAALLSIPPIAILRFGFAVLSFLLSGFFLLRNIYPILTRAQSKAAQTLVLGVAAVHFAFAVLLWFYFLNAGDAAAKSPAGPGRGDISDPAGGALSSANAAVLDRGTL